MDFGCINLVVKNPDVAMMTYLKLMGTNNVQEVIKLEGLTDTVDTVDGYYMKTRPLHLGVFTPRDSKGRMGQYLEKYGEGIHHIDMFLGQDEFEETYARFKKEGRPVSEKVAYIGRFSEAWFWLDGSGEQGVPIKYATKTYRGLSMWENTDYLDTPRKFRKIKITEEYIRPRVVINSVMVTVNDWEHQRQIWSSIVSRPATEQGNIFTLEPGQVDDGRGNIFVPVRFQFSQSKGINLYCALNKEAPINKVMGRRGVTGMFHNLAGYVTRDRVHEYFKQLEESDFAMVDPKPALNKNKGNGNYFFFVHPICTHGVLWEFVSMFTRGETVKARFDWSDTEIFMVPPDVNK
ncbi:MAG: hypothetical protein A2Y92_02880 [Chloroflexi bacterium RBG_13_57_8]|nr:MAG: hypothetical protein A2Y92_02880 [Chloroflexi bacterium RBG_13_57_8]